MGAVSTTVAIGGHRRYETPGMFTLSKIVWLLLAPANLYFLLLLLGVVLLVTRWRRAGRRLLVGLAAFGLIVAIVPLGEWLLLPLENRFPPPSPLAARVDGIVVLGGSIDQQVSAARGQPSLGGGAERLIAAVGLARRYPNARLLFTGGSGDPFGQDLKEAPVARQVFSELGLVPDIAAGRVQFEDRSRNTFENAVYAYQLAQPAANAQWLLITSARHMPRAMGTFRKVGWPVTAFPVDYATDGAYDFAPVLSFASGFGSLTDGLKEWLGLLYYYVLGRTNALFPAPGA